MNRVNEDGPARWTRRHLDLLTTGPLTLAPETTAPPAHTPAPPRVLPGDDVWDLWPIQEEDGSISVVLGRELWMALSAPAAGHPEERHDHARIRLLARDGDGWHDLGPAFADGASPGSREWSGSAVRRPDGTVSVFYTAAGRRGEARPTFLQSVVETRPAVVVAEGGRVLLDRAAGHREVLRSDGRAYLPADEIDGGPGRIRAFRDPGWFRDPADGREYLLVAASVAASGAGSVAASAGGAAVDDGDGGYMGAVALAEARDGGWSLLPPLLVADGVNHEIERPHVVVRDSSYYLFFSTQRHSFHPPGSAPTGLYGFVAPRLTGPYAPLNGSGLVAANPPEEPDQAYAWLVMPDLRVVSFVNYRSVGGGADPLRAGAAEARAAFGGTIAPVFRLALDGARTRVVVPAATAAPIAGPSGGEQREQGVQPPGRET
ncbi:glycoside hydrolase family 68 protein [Microbispora triticiradicis]|uniref:Glycoside hydrolase family 68 protein n=1 Tax=Microbispora triticiradicis TaxID=2200763 RepID=A0ABX9LQ08_9ACTN|nr:glycoside hydrolase family 68 protein [Microbispora triticiradicis]